MRWRRARSIRSRVSRTTSNRRLALKRRREKERHD